MLGKRLRGKGDVFDDEIDPVISAFKARDGGYIQPTKMWGSSHAIDERRRKNERHT
jgi:hypothetical protein